jgi:hypothetical protein
MTEDFGTEDERPVDAPRDYPALIDRIRQYASELATDANARVPGDDDTLRKILEGLVDLGGLAAKALDHWPGP